MPLKIPPMRGGRSGEQYVSIRDVGGGADLKSSRFVIPPNKMLVVQNYYLVEDGSLVGRRGTTRWNAASLGSGAALGATRANFAAGNHFLVAHNGSIYLGADGPQTFASSLAGLNASSPVWMWQYLNFVYVANQIDTPRKWDGTSWTVMGITAPGSGPTAAVGAAGALTGTYTFKVTFYTATLESNESPASGSVVLVAQQANLTSIPLGPTGTVRRRIYGFKTAVSSVYQLIGEINDNTTTVFTVSTDQDSWTTAIPTDHNPPVTGAWLFVQFRNRGWKAGDPANPTRLYFSQAFIPEAWPTGFYIDLPFSKGDVITGLYVSGDLLYVFGHTEVFYVAGTTPFSFIAVKTFTEVGCPSPWAIDRMPGGVLAYLGRFGVYLLSGAQSTPLSDPIEPQFTGISQAVLAMNYTSADRSTLRYYDRLKAFVVSFPAGVSTTNDTTWWYFTRRKGWTQDTRTSRLLMVTDGKGDPGQLYSLDVDAGIMRQWDPSGVYTDDGTAISCRFKTGVHTGPNPLMTNTWTYLTIRAKPANVVLQISAELDQGVENDSFTIDLRRGALYGSGTYGTSTYAPDFDDFEERFDAKMRGRGIALDVVATYAEQHQVAQLFLTQTPVTTRRRRVGV